MSNITAEQAFSLAPHVLQNAGRLKNAGNVLGEAGYVGPAISLLILASEEFTKSIILTTKALEAGISDALLARVLYDHRVRHALSALGRVTTTSALDHPRIADLPDTPAAIEEIAGMMPLLTNIAASQFDWTDKDRLTQEISWWAAADVLKQRGLYVDHNGDTPQGPLDLGKEDYETAKFYVESYFRDLAPVIEPWLNAPRELGVEFVRVLKTTISPELMDSMPDMPPKIERGLSQLFESLKKRRS